MKRRTLSILSVPRKGKMLTFDRAVPAPMRHCCPVESEARAMAMWLGSAARDADHAIASLEDAAVSLAKAGVTIDLGELDEPLGMLVAIRDEAMAREKAEDERAKKAAEASDAAAKWTAYLDDEQADLATRRISLDLHRNGELYVAACYDDGPIEDIVAELRADWPGVEVVMGPPPETEG